jgi:hypothetical protein
VVVVEALPTHQFLPMIHIGAIIEQLEELILVWSMRALGVSVQLRLS